MKHQIQSLLLEIQAILSASSITVGRIIQNPEYDNNKHQGVYCIRDGNNEIIYVGQTIGGKDGVAQRIWDHANGISELMEFLNINKKKFETFNVQSKEIQDIRLRSRVELFGIAVLNPVGNKLGRLK